MGPGDALHESTVGPPPSPESSDSSFITPEGLRVRFVTEEPVREPMRAHILPPPILQEYSPDIDGVCHVESSSPATIISSHREPETDPDASLRRAPRVPMCWPSRPISCAMLMSNVCRNSPPWCGESWVPQARSEEPKSPSTPGRGPERQSDPGRGRPAKIDCSTEPANFSNLIAAMQEHTRAYPSNPVNESGIDPFSRAEELDRTLGNLADPSSGSSGHASRAEFVTPTPSPAHGSAPW